MREDYIVFQHYMTTGGLKMIVCLLIVPFVLHEKTPSAVKRWMSLFFIPSFLALNPYQYAQFVGWIPRRVHRHKYFEK